MANKLKIGKTTEATSLQFFQRHQTDTASQFNFIAMSPSETKLPYTIIWMQNAFM
tara:strand:+ start:3965 stop:4129 length:165 start_codon:yes stop_codon:yes gene_type:complete